MCLLGPSIQVGALKALDTQHGKAKVNQVCIICGRPVAKLEVVHIQLRCRERAAVKINTVQWSRGQHVTCWDSIEEPVRANTQLHVWRADDMRPLTVFQNKSSPPSSTHTHTRFWSLNCRILRRSWRVEPSIYIHEMPSWSCICWLAKTTFQFFLSSYKNKPVLSKTRRIARHKWRHTWTSYLLEKQFVLFFYCRLKHESLPWKIKCYSERGTSCFRTWQ